MQFGKSEIVFHNFGFFCISPACNFYISISLNNESFETEKKTDCSRAKPEWSDCHLTSLE